MNNLRPDSPPPLTRRDLLRTAGIATVGAGFCGSLAAAVRPSARANLERTLAAIGRPAAVMSGICALTPSLTEGPYYLNNRLVRQDITEGKPGLETWYFFLVVDQNCNPVSGAIVDIWHNDGLGVYSGFANQGTQGQTFIRGVQQRSASPTPPAREGHVLVYDPLRQRVVLSAGRAGGGTPLSDVWEYDGSRWTEIAAQLDPNLGHSTRATYDARGGRTLLFGWDASVSQGVTWEWDGSFWYEHRLPWSPAGLAQSALVFDEVHQRPLLLSAGLTGNEVFEWTGLDWQLVSVAAGVPGRHPMAYDVARRRVVSVSAASSTMLFGDLAPATTQAIGTACLGVGGLPVLTAGLPHVGNQGFSLDLMSARASAPIVFAFAQATQSLALGGGCSLYVLAPVVALATASDTNGFGTATVAVPLVPALRGRSLFAQAVVVDPAGAFAGLAFSAGLRVTFGD